MSAVICRNLVGDEIFKRHGIGNFFIIYPYAYRYDPEGDQNDMMNNTIRSGQVAFYSNDGTVDICAQTVGVAVDTLPVRPGNLKTYYDFRPGCILFQ